MGGGAGAAEFRGQAHAPGVPGEAFPQPGTGRDARADLLAGEPVLGGLRVRVPVAGQGTCWACRCLTKQHAIAATTVPAVIMPCPPPRGLWSDRSHARLAVLRGKYPSAASAGRGEALFGYGPQHPRSR